MQIIGIAGAARSGKNTVGEMIAKELRHRGKTVALDAFAFKLKIIAAADFGWDGVKDEKGRALLQHIGSEKRAENPNHWIDELAASYPHEGGGNPDFLVITDVRYENEAEFVRELGVLWFVRGRGETLTGAAAGHESEAFNWPLCAEDIVVPNNGSLEDLKTLVAAMISCNQHIMKPIGSI